MSIFMRATLATAKNDSSGIARVLGICASDPRFVYYLNEAIRRLLTRGLFWGSYQKFSMCVNNGCLTFPRQFAAIEVIAVCNRPLKIRNEWFEFNSNGAGLYGSNAHRFGCGGMQMLDRGTACCFADIIGVNKKIKVYADVAEATGAKILLQGYDENGNWIRTQVAGEWVDGEYVLCSTTPQTTTKFFSSLTGVQKPITNGNIRLYEYDTDLTTQRAIAVYEPDETLPSYRRSFITGFGTGGCCNTGSCESKTVSVIAKMEFIPVRNDTDYLILGNIPAIKDEVQSIRKSENNLIQESAAYEAKAVFELNKELEHYLGHGIVQPIVFKNAGFASASVPNMI